MPSPKGDVIFDHRHNAESSVSPAMHNDVGQRMDLRRFLIVHPRNNQPRRA
jgi:hypothetical protein